MGKEGMEEGGEQERETIPVGLTWSFPMDQTSLWDGSVKIMGKGYTTHKGIEGESLREHFHAGFRKQVRFLARSKGRSRGTNIRL